MDLCEFKASLVYKVSSRTARATQRKKKNPVSTTTTTKSFRVKRQKRINLTYTLNGNFLDLLEIIYPSEK